MADTLARVHERLARTVQNVEDENTRLRKRIVELEVEVSSGEMGRLRSENARLTAELAAAVPERQELALERDASLKKLQSIRETMRELLNETKVRYGRFSVLPHLTVRPQVAGFTFDDPELAINQEEHEACPAMTGTLSSSAGALRRPSSQSSLRTLTPATNGSPNRHSIASTSTLVANTEATGLGAAFVDSRQALGKDPYNRPSARHTHRITSAEFGSPIRRPLPNPRSVSLNMSPGLSDGLSVQYEDLQSSSTGTNVRTKWRIHFAKPPSTARIAMGPFGSTDLAERLELDDETVTYPTLLAETMV